MGGVFPPVNMVLPTPHGAKRKLKWEWGVETLPLTMLRSQVCKTLSL